MTDFLTHPAFIWSVVGFVISLLIFWMISFVVASYFVYVCTLKRRKKEQWGRDLPSEITPEHISMYDTGLVWAQQNNDKKEDVHIVSGGLNLYGEYYDFGYDRCAIILSGRTESLRYGYYFAIPYAKNGCNILVTDPRAHGLSDGTYNTVGFEESGDYAAWIKMLHEEKGISSVVLHGICIGSAGGLLALTTRDCPPIVDALVAEGMFPNFGESVKNHMREQRRVIFPTFMLVNMWMKKYTGHSMKKGPIDVIDKLQTPLLMLHSKEDIYSTPEYAQKLFDKAGSKNKKLVWFDHGRHSMLRITDTERYDNAIAELLSSLPVPTTK